MGHELRLEWKPNSGPKSGEVTGATIRIYEADPTKALDTLRHEFIEYLLTQALVAPYKRLINKLISLFEEEMYDRKERLVERLQELAK
jgi:vacuolar-type H+-ATPase catalytic subunit A/Vma1